MGKIVSCEFFCCAFRKLCFFEMLLCLCSNADWDGGDESVLEWGIFLSEWVAFFNGFVMGKGSGVLCCGEFVCLCVVFAVVCLIRDYMKFMPCQFDTGIY